MVWPALTPPVTTLNVRLVLLREMGVTGPPDAADVSFTTNGIPFAALSVMMMAPLSNAATGVNATLTLQLPFYSDRSVITPVHVTLTVKSLLDVMVLTVTALDEALEILKVFAVLCVPIVPPVKLRLAGAVVTGAAPVPVRPTNASRFLALSYMLAAPVMDPMTVGVKNMFAVQVPPPPATLPLQLSVSVKSPLVAKVTGTDDAPLFVIVTGFEAVITPTIVFENARLAGETTICAHEFRLAVTNKAESNRTL
jgi:hypothetical protein